MKFKPLALAAVIAAAVAAPAHAQSYTVRQNLVISNYAFVDLDPDDGIDASGSVASYADNSTGGSGTWTGSSVILTNGSGSVSGNGVDVTTSFQDDGRGSNVSVSNSGSSFFFMQARSGDLAFTVGRGTGLMLEFGYGARVFGDAAVNGSAIYAASASMSEDNALANSATLWFGYHESVLNSGGVMDVYSQTASVLLSNTTDAAISSGLHFDFAVQGTKAVTAVPEPDAMLLGGIAGLGVLVARRRQRGRMS